MQIVRCPAFVGWIHCRCSMVGSLMGCRRARGEGHLALRHLTGALRDLLTICDVSTSCHTPPSRRVSVSLLAARAGRPYDDAAVTFIARKWTNMRYTNMASWHR